MTIKSKLALLGNLMRYCFETPLRSRRVLQNLAQSVRAADFARSWRTGGPDEPTPNGEMPQEIANPLRNYFDGHLTGRGIWKWLHYFDIYHRHFNKFVGREVHIVEIGVFSGGSLDMWHSYFGPKCRVYGVDIEPACRSYEKPGTRVFIGDQADRTFWRNFRHEVPTVDILLDDGGHMPEQQIITLEDMLPHLRPGGIYLCEDVQWLRNPFAAYLYGLWDALNTQPGEDARTLSFRRDIRGMHLYPFVSVIERCERPRAELSLVRHGTEWQPFL
jgi:hypothetical protein